MSEHEIAGKKKPEKGDQARRTKGLEPRPMPPNLMDRDTSSHLIDDPLFNPPIQRHTDLLLNASAEHKIVIARQLQQTYGNKYVQRLAKSMNVQSRLTVGAADDPYEREADRIAGQVMSNQHIAQRQTPREEVEELQAKPLASCITPLVQRQVPEEDEEIQAQRQAEEEEEPIQMKISQVQSQAEEEEDLQMQPIGNQIPTASENLETSINYARGSGHTLPDNVREPMERAFGSDFSGVRVHNNSEANTLNQQLHAKAFTTGQDIFFREGEYSPGSNSGCELIAHELTHTVQQTGTNKPQRQPIDEEEAQMKPDTSLSIPKGRQVVAGTIQRAIGLATAVVTNIFAKNAYDFWKDAGNKDKPLKDLADFLITKVNEKLPYPCTPVYSTSGTAGAFDRVTWTIEMNTDQFSSRVVNKVGDLNREEVGELVDTIYHEARHSEQAFKVAQMKAAEGKKATDIEKELSIPAQIAASAFTRPLKGTEETKGWEAFTGGRYEKYYGEVSKLRDEINELRAVFDSGSKRQKITRIATRLNKIEQHINDYFDDEQKKIEKLKNQETVDKSVLKNIKAIKLAFNNFKAEYNNQKGDPAKYDIAKLEGLALALHEARYTAYRDAEDEKDAWAVGGAAGEAFKKKAGG
jgi:hypothetical protein